jgi:hypothetical protein
MERPFQTGDLVRVSRIPPHVVSPEYPYVEVRQAFEFALGHTYEVEDVDQGGWVRLKLEGERGGIGVQPDCVELVRAKEKSK